MTYGFQCNACGAQYDDIMRDGSLYFHACAPLKVDKNGVEAERPNKRDENLFARKRGVPPSITSEGDGVTSLKNSQLSEPAWITVHKAALAKQEAADSD